MEQGPTEKTIIELAYRQGAPLPDKIKNAPDVEMGLMLYWLAFLDLTTCRQQGYGAEGPITWLSVDEYATRNGYFGEQREDLHYLISKMDAAYIEHHAKKLDAKTNPKTPKKKGSKK